MIKAHVDAAGALANVKKMLDRSRDLRPVLLAIRGSANSNEPMTVIGGIKQAFATKGGSIGMPWLELSAQYAKRKFEKYGARPILFGTGTLYKSTVQPGATGNVEILSWRKLVFGTAIPYAGYHQSDEPRSKLPRRPFMSVTKAQRLMWKRLITGYLKDAKLGKEVYG